MILGYCKLADSNVKLLEFGKGKEFNYVRGQEVVNAEIRRQLKDSIEISIDLKSSGIERLKITNQSLLTWDDHWIDKGSGKIIDPEIQELVLSQNDLVYVNINTPRPSLKVLDVKGNKNLKVLHLHECFNLETLDISQCQALENVSLGVNRNIQTLNAKDCNMTSSAMEQLLRDFTPVITASSNNRGAGAFRSPHNTLLDLRGNVIDWSNRRIASKIRMLVTNNWVVKWSNNPPAEIVPPQLYARFVESRIEISEFK
jgi:hypothetical protein